LSIVRAEATVNKTSTEASMSEARFYTFRDPAPLARTVVIWLYVHIGVTILYGLTSAAALVAQPAADGAESVLLGLSAIPLGIAALVVAFLILKWIYRVSRNAHSAARGLTISPPWAVGWFFVPIAFLWKPFQGVREAWQASTTSEAWQKVPVPSILRWWWGLFLVSNFLGQLSFRLSTMGGPATSGAASATDVISTFVDVPLDLVFIAIVNELTRKQIVDLTFGEGAAAVA
jgi:hypothetical protein